MTVFTVFFCGTCSNRYDSHNPAYPHGELVSTLADNHAGSEFVDWIIIDGPGSGDLQNDEKWTKHTKSGMTKQIVFGDGWEENVSHAVALIKGEYEWKRETLTAAEVKKLKAAGVDLEGKDDGGYFWRKVHYERKVTPQDLQLQKAKIMRKGALPTVINMLGWSRGAVSCTMLANALAKEPKLAGIPVHIFAVDPVPGPRNFQPHRTTLPANVKSYVAVYARDERSKIMRPIVPKAKGTKPAVLTMPGRHATLVGNGAVDGEKGAQKLGASGRMVRQLAEAHLTQWGTKLNKMLNVSKGDQLKLYEQILNDDALYVALHEKTYAMGGEDDDDQRIMAVGEKAVASPFPSVKGGEYLDPIGLSTAEDPKQPGAKFVNWHHLSLDK